MRYVFYAVDGAAGRVVTGATTAGIEATQVAVTQALVAVGLFVAVVAVGGSWWLVGRVLAPLSALAAELETIEPDELDRPFVGRPGRDEVGRLTRSTADLLARLDEDRRRPAGLRRCGLPRPSNAARCPPDRDRARPPGPVRRGAPPSGHRSGPRRRPSGSGSSPTGSSPWPRPNREAGP
ncbi:MAG: hypothetical protein KatS3mg065_0942 [Chloroflexota bacterium]|nr:MAG: hypothetical protein KatS3mg065_0942 [Chloroflexota bacterium]